MRSRFFYNRPYANIKLNGSKGLRNTPEFKRIEKEQFDRLYGEYGVQLEHILTSPQKISENQLEGLRSKLDEMRNFTHQRDTDHAFKSILSTFNFIRNRRHLPKHALLKRLYDCQSLNHHEAKILIKLNPPKNLHLKTNHELDNYIELLKIIQQRSNQENRLLANIHDTILHKLPAHSATSVEKAQMIKHLSASYRCISHIESKTLADTKNMLHKARLIQSTLDEITISTNQGLQIAKAKLKEGKHYTAMTHIKRSLRLLDDTTKSLFKDGIRKHEQLNKSLTNLLIKKTGHLLEILQEMGPALHNLLDTFHASTKKSLEQLENIYKINPTAYFSYHSAILHGILGVTYQFTNNTKKATHHSSQAINLLKQLHIIAKERDNITLCGYIKKTLDTFSEAMIKPDQFKQDRSSEDSDESSKKRKRINDDVELEKSYKIRKL